MKIKRLRRIRDVVKLLDAEYNINLTYYELKKLYDLNKINGYRDGNTIYLFYDEVIEKFMEGELIYGIDWKETK